MASFETIPIGRFEHHPVIRTGGKGGEESKAALSGSESIVITSLVPSSVNFQFAHSFLCFCHQCA